MFHSDHGCQYTSAEFKACCERLGIVLVLDFYSVAFKNGPVRLGNKGDLHNITLY